MTELAFVKFARTLKYKHLHDFDFIAIIQKIGLPEIITPFTLSRKRVK